MSRKKRHDGGKIVNNFFRAKRGIACLGSEKMSGAEQGEHQTGNQIVPDMHADARAQAAAAARSLMG
jgi:hypothetical protein